MAAQTKDTQFNPYLSTTQQDLLLAALTSNTPKNKVNSYPTTKPAVKRSSSDHTNQPQFDPTMFTSPQQAPPSTNFGSLDYDESPFLDYLDGGDSSFDMNGNDLGGDMIGSLPGGDSSSSDTVNEIEKHDKRKNPDEEGDSEDELDSKRREGADKNPKKPGRKPLTSEPTTVRTNCTSVGGHVLNCLAET